MLTVFIFLLKYDDFPIQNQLRTSLKNARTPANAEGQNLVENGVWIIRPRFEISKTVISSNS